MRFLKKTKKFLAVLLAVALIIPLVNITTDKAYAASTDVVTIPDAALKAKIYERLGKESTETVTKGELATITYLSFFASSDVVSDLTGLEYCTNLKTLTIRLSESCTDYSAISKLNNLTSLDIRNMYDLAGLEKLTKLTTLKLEYTDNSAPYNLTGLEKCTGLESLYVKINDKCTDCSAIFKLHNLTYLDTEGMHDLTGLDKLTNLTSLYLDYSDSTDYSSISKLTNLEKLDIGESKIVALPDLSQLTNLTELNVQRCNNLADITGLSGCNNLVDVDLEGTNKITDITPLKGKTSITKLRLEKVDITDSNEQGYMETIASLVNLKKLYLAYCEIEDKHVSMFDNLTKLETLEMVYSNLTNCDFLLRHKDTLKHLTLHGNDISDNNVLGQMKNLSVLGIGGTHITDFSFISQLPKLGNGSIRIVNWEEDFPTVTYHTESVVVDVSDDTDVVVVKNVVKNENGILVAPVDSELYSYDAQNGEIVIDKSNLNYEIRVPYEFIMSSQKGSKLYAEHGMYLELFYIKSQPSDVTTAEGNSPTLSVQMSRTPDSYQWYKDGVAISDGTNRILELKDVTLEDAGNYNVKIKIGDEILESEVAKVTINEVPIEIKTQPQDVELFEGKSTTLKVEATGLTPLRYQWYKDGVKLEGKTSKSLSLSQVTEEDAGQYKVVITDRHNKSITSNVVTVDVETILAITSQPTGVTLIEGENGSLNVTAVGEGTLSYQWYKDGTAIAGATKATLSLGDVTAEDAGNYKVIVMDENGSKTSNTVKVEIETALAITSQPTGITLVEGENGSLSVTAVGEGTLTYQWYKDGTAIAEATKAILSLSDVTAEDAGNYKVTVTDKNGSKTSNEVTVEVETALVITSQPTGVTLDEGENGSLSVTAVGEGTLSYQWYKDGDAIPGATGAILPLNTVIVSNAGTYKVVVSDANGSVTSDEVKVVVNEVVVPEPEPQPKPEPQPEPEPQPQPTAPKTDDNTPWIFCGGLFVCAAAAMLVVVRKKRVM